MATGGTIGLVTALVGSLISVACLLMGCAACKKKPSLAATAWWAGRVTALVCTGCLVLCCFLLVYCFMSGDLSLLYVVQYRSDSSSSLAWLYQLSGLWAGREGSLLLWATLLAAFGAVIALRRGRRVFERIDGAALALMQVILAVFLFVLLCAPGNMPFVALPAEYLNASGQLVGSATLWGMSPLLEHWAMAIHPPTLFIGYAGLTVPFAYALAALIVGDASLGWVKRCSRMTVFAWLFLGLGIGIGAVWAYVVLGWGGYWGWDPVENASLLSWLLGVALIHSFTVYRTRASLKRWTIACACLTLSFVALGAFITRSGIVGSVHAFDGDPASSTLFLGLIVVPLVAGGIGLALRWRKFAPETRALEGESLLSKNAAYCMNNFVMLVSALLVAYMTVAAALPVWMPFGGHTFSADAYNAVALPIGLLYFVVFALCPVLSWGKTGVTDVRKRLRVTGTLALVLAVCLVVYQVAYLAPLGGDAVAQGVLPAETPWWCVHVLAFVGYCAASFLFCTSLYTLVRAVRRNRNSAFQNTRWQTFRVRVSALGGALAHGGMAIMLVGLIGSTLFVAKAEGVVSRENVGEALSIGPYTVRFQGERVEAAPNGTDLFNTVELEVARGGEFIAQAQPSMQVVAATGQQQLHAAVVHRPLEDVFLVYRGLTSQGELSLEVRINPLIGFVWTGIVLLAAGSLVACMARRQGISSASGNS